ncbi:hypothetical protein CDAR_452111 [Caerostris darwini]|uniref:Uncharacterized protein n=1 Tax=Caerostris darwini TaxID=1538125 RepID=A0AAV4PQY3_9ARAC|nr:hypothetical protein CDAR_452111 [Caerostris darwini]
MKPMITNKDKNEPEALPLNTNSLRNEFSLSRRAPSPALIPNQLVINSEEERDWAACSGKHGKSTWTNGWRWKGIRNCDCDVPFAIQVQHWDWPQRIAAHLHGVLPCDRKPKYSLDA